MYLMHRMSHEGEASKKLLKEENLISIGWSLLSQNQSQYLIEYAKSHEKWDFAQEFVHIGKEINIEWLTRTRSYYLYNFLRLEEGDTVIIPFPGTITICRVKGNARIHNHKTNADIGFVVPVEIMHENINRNKYVPNKLSSNFKYQGTNLVISEENSMLVNEMIESYRNKEESYNFGETKKKLINLVDQYINKLKENHFELLVKSYLESLGADVVKIPSKNTKSNQNDLIADIDVKAAFNKLGISIYVQAKRHEGMTDDTGIRQLDAFKVDEDSDFEVLQPVKWLITTGNMSEENLRDAKEKEIRVIRNDEFAELLVESGFTFDDNIFD